MSAAVRLIALHAGENAEDLLSDNPTAELALQVPGVVVIDTQMLMSGIGSRAKPPSTFLSCLVSRLRRLG